MRAAADDGIHMRACQRHSEELADLLLAEDS